MHPNLIVVGGGIAGCEAAYAVARAGVPTLLVTTSLDTLYVLAHDEHEILVPAGSLMAACTGREGRADVRAAPLRREAKRLLEAQPRLHLLQSTVSDLLVEDGRVRGVATWEGVDRLGERVALCVGSFLEARLSVGASEEHAGRLSEMAYDDLYEDLAARGFGFEWRRLEHAGAAGALPYSVDFRVFAPDEWSATDSRLTRLADLYAAGVCVGADGYLAAVRSGMALAGAVLAGAA